MAFIKQLRISVRSANPYQLKVMQSNLNITDSSDSKCINFKATRQKATVKQKWIFTEIITDPYLRSWYKCLKSLSLEQILTHFLMNSGHKRILQYSLHLKSKFILKKREEEREARKSEASTK